MKTNDSSVSYDVLRTPKTYELNELFNKVSPNAMDIERIGNLFKGDYDVKTTSLPDINGSKWFCGVRIKNDDGCAYLLFPLQKWNYENGTAKDVTVLTKGNLDVKDIDNVLDTFYIELSKQDPYCIKTEWSQEISPAKC